MSSAPSAAASDQSVRTVVRDDGKRDQVAVEEPLEIRVGGVPLAVTMRTPGHDEELATGFLYGEGLIDAPPEVGPTDDFAANTIEVRSPLVRELPPRRFYTTSSCGVCGKGALEEVEALVQALGERSGGDGPLRDRRHHDDSTGEGSTRDRSGGANTHAAHPGGSRWTRELLASLPDRLVQPGFRRTGGTHATGVFGADGRLLFAYEDVGRHNAMDKAVGRALLDGLLPLREHALCVSGRLSFELVQKAAMAGAPVLVGVGAPSSLAIELAHTQRMTLCGFARGGRLNVYTGAERIGRR